jgi:hypothetical protein
VTAGCCCCCLLTQCFFVIVVAVAVAPLPPSPSSSAMAVGEQELSHTSEHVDILLPSPPTRTVHSQLPPFNSTIADIADNALPSVVPPVPLQQQPPMDSTTIDAFLHKLHNHSVDLHQLPKLVSKLHKLCVTTTPDVFVQTVFAVPPGDRNRLTDLIVLKTLSLLLPTFPPKVVRNHLYSLLPYCFAYLEDSDTIFRQASMIALVDLYTILRTEILPHLSSLSSAQRKLLLIYAEKRNSEAPSIKRFPSCESNAIPV